MVSIKITFTRAATNGDHHVSIFVLALLMLAIDEDWQDAEERRKERARAATQPPRPKPPADPRPF